MKILSYIYHELASKSGYTALFKALLVLVALYLISIIQVASLAIPIEADAHKYKYIVEYEVQKKLEFSDLECSFNMKSYEACKMAIYNNNLSSKSMTALIAFQDILLFFISLLGLLVILSFLFTPYISKEDMTKN